MSERSRDVAREMDDLRHRFDRAERRLKAVIGAGLVLGLAILYFAAIPDMAAVRDHTTGARQRRYQRMAMGWHGTPHQWKVLQVGISVLGGFYFMFLIFTHLMISVDFAMSLIPGWKDAIFPAFHAMMGLHSGVALMLVTMFILRWKGGLKEYLEVDQFWGLSKLLLALCLMWFYFWWAGFYTYWYGRTEAEQSVLKLLMTETYRIPFFLAFALSFVVPFLILMWNITRKTTWGPALAGAIVLVGTFFNVIRLYVPPGPYRTVHCMPLKSLHQPTHQGWRMSWLS